MYIQHLTKEYRRGKWALEDLSLELGDGMFGLEYYRAVTGLLILASVVARDKSTGALDLVLSELVNRRRLLRERLLTTLASYLIICVIASFCCVLSTNSFPFQGPDRLQPGGKTRPTWDSPWIWLPVKLCLLLLFRWQFFLTGWLLDAGPKQRRALIVLVISFPVLFLIG